MAASREPLRKSCNLAQRLEKAGSASTAQSRRVKYGPPFVLGRTRSRAARLSGVAAVAGHEWLDKGLRRLDALSRVTDQSRRIVAATGAARTRLLRAQLLLTAKDLRLERSLAAARQAEQRLASAAAARLAYISSLRREARMQAAQVRSVEAAAQSAQRKSQPLQRTT